jgi:hypothetical protein
VRQVPRVGGALRPDARHTNAIRQASDRAHEQIELGLELRDSCELDAQLPFGTGKPLVYGRARFHPGAASNPVRSRGRRDGRKYRLSHGDCSNLQGAYARAERPAVLNGTPSRLASRVVSKPPIGRPFKDILRARLLVL